MTTNLPAPVTGKPSRRRPGLATILATGAALAGLATIPALTANAAPATARPTTSSSPDVRVSFFFGENRAASGSSTWEWISGTIAMHFDNQAARGFALGSATLGSTNGRPVAGRLGICWQPSAGGPIEFGSAALLAFTAPRGQWVTQTVSGAILPARGGFPPGIYKIGLCVLGTSRNLAYNTNPAAATGDALVAENSAGA